MLDKHRSVWLILQECECNDWNPNQLNHEFSFNHKSNFIIIVERCSKNFLFSICLTSEPIVLLLQQQWPHNLNNKPWRSLNNNNAKRLYWLWDWRCRKSKTTICTQYANAAAGCFTLFISIFSILQNLFDKWWCEFSDRWNANDKDQPEKKGVESCTDAWRVCVCSLWKIWFFNYVASFMRCTDLFMISSAIVVVVVVWELHAIFPIHSFSPMHLTFEIMNHFCPSSLVPSTVREEKKKPLEWLFECLC